jgi:hypothetical protein
MVVAESTGYTFSLSPANFRAAFPLRFAKAQLQHAVFVEACPAD